MLLDGCFVLLFLWFWDIADSVVYFVSCLLWLACRLFFIGVVVYCGFVFVGCLLVLGFSISVGFVNLYFDLGCDEQLLRVFC